MELHYIWIEEYRSLLQEDLNISSKYNFSYNQRTLELTIEDKADYINDFFPNTISNITAIVGENGTGKTSLLDFIKETLSLNNTTYRRKIIIAYTYKGNNKIIIQNADEEKFSINNKSKSTFTRIPHKHYASKPQFNPDFVKNDLNLKRKISLLESIEDFKECIFIFYSNIFDYRSETSTSFMHNLSTNYLAERYGDKFRYKEVQSQVDFITNNDTKSLGISLPKNIKIRYKHTRSALNFINRKAPYYIKELYDILALSIEKSRFVSGYKSQKLTLINLLMTNYFIETLAIFNNIYSTETYFKDVINKFSPYKSHNYIEEFIYKTIVDYIKYFASHPISEVVIDVESIPKPHSLLAIIKIISESSIEIRSTKTESYFEVNLKQIPRFDVKNFIHHYINSFNQFNIIEFDWQDMSSGEKARLAFLSRLQSIKNRNKINKKFQLKNIIIMIDEGEQYFHPQWQKEYISFLISKLPNIFSESNIQIILTSHSPFVLSDLTRNNVIYLRKNDKNDKLTEIIKSESKAQTFASNIHLLFTDAYFMKDGLIGSFAQSKISQMLSPLIKNKLTTSNKKSIKAFIEIIGEPVLKNKLLSLLEQNSKK